jgi:hypothetical protein
VDGGKWGRDSSSMSISFSPAWSDKIKVAPVGFIVTFVSIISAVATIFENAVRLEVWLANYCSWCWHDDATLFFLLQVFDVVQSELRYLVILIC